MAQLIPQLTRQQREAKGRRAEQIAMWFLRLKFYRLLAVRYKTPVGEIDLIMRHGPDVVFVEVKARDSLEAGLEAVTPQQQLRMQQAATWFMAKNPPQAPYNWRFDVVVVRPRHLPYHAQNVLINTT